MQTKCFKPSPKYLTKLRLIMIIVAVLVLAGGTLFGWLLSFDREIGTSGGWIVFIGVAVADAVWWVPAMFLTGPYYGSLSYDIQDDEVIVHAGIWTQSVKHVPYRTVTNLTVKRGILDRWLGLGTLDIQTAGMSGTTGAEESLVGLSNVQETYEIVVTELRRFRGSMAPTATELEDKEVEAPTDALSAILAQVRAIRQTLEKRA